MDNLNKSIKEAIDTIQSIKNNILSYINDETVPFDTRFNFWINLPEIFVNSSLWYLFPEDYSWFKYGYTKYQDVDLSDVWKYSDKDSFIFNFETEKEQIEYFKTMMKTNTRIFNIDW